MRRRLVSLSLATTSMVVLAFLLPLGALLRASAVDRVTYDTEVAARALAPVVATTDDPTGLSAAIAASETGVGSRTSVVLPDATVLGAPAPVDPPLRAALDGQAVTVHGDGVVRSIVPVVRGDGTIAAVQVVAPAGALGPGVARAWAVLVALGAALVGAAVLLADRLGRSTVRAVGDLGRVATRLGEGDLDARSDVADPPEVAAVARALEDLAGRIERLLVAERETIADLSHRLRTPLMALRLDVDALPDSAAASRLRDDAAQLEQAVDQAIRRARRQGGPTAPEEHADLAQVVVARARFWQVLAEDQGRPFDAQVPPGAWPVTVAVDELEAAVDALLGNVLRHTPPSSGLRVHVVPATDGHVLLVVEDDGPGFREAATAPARGSSTEGTGLGLDIVRQVVERTGGRLELVSGPTGGARVTARFVTAHHTHEAAR